MLTAASLFAISQGSANEGIDDVRCHWCGSPATRTFRHNDIPPVPFSRSKSTAKAPFSNFCCVGCWLWQRGSVTVNFLTGDYKDRQQAKNHSWWINEEGAWALRAEDHSHLWQLISCPPLRFTLALLDGGKTTNLLQLMIANDHKEILRETQLWFTINGIPHSYSIHELEAGLKGGESGREPGVRALMRLLSAAPSKLTHKEKRGDGRPSVKELPDRPNKLVVAQSGVLIGN